MIKIQVDPEPFMAYMDDLNQERQIPFAISKGLNLAANKVQAAIKAHLEASFAIKRKTWVLRRIYIAPEDRSNKTEWSVTIQVNADRDFLSKFESGGDKVHTNGSAHFAIPNRQVFSKPIMAGDPLRISNLALKMTPHGLQGNKGTFLEHDKAGTPLIIQDTKLAGKGRKKGVVRKTGNRVLYVLVKNVKLPAKLEFVSTGTNTFNESYEGIFNKVIQDAIDTAK